MSTFDLTRGDSDVSETGDPQTVQGDESTTETERGYSPLPRQNSSQRRRLRLVWNKPPHRQVWAAPSDVRRVVEEGGPSASRCTSAKNCAHKWSVLNVPLMWDAAGQERGDWFSQGRWGELVESALKMEAPVPRKREVLTEAERRGRAAQDGVRRGQVSRARQKLVGSVLAPKDHRRP